MLFFEQFRKYLRDLFLKARHFIVLSKKAYILLFQSKSWTVVGIRILNRIYAVRHKIPLYMFIFFPKSCAWYQLKIENDLGSDERVGQAVKRLLRYRHVFYEYNLVEFSLDNLLRAIEDRNSKVFETLYRKKFDELKRKNLSGIHEIDMAFFLKTVPKNKFFIDAKNFLFLLPVKYMYRTSEHKNKLKDYVLRFKLPSEIHRQSNKVFELQVDGDIIWDIHHVKLLKGYQIIDDNNYICYEKAAEPAHKFIAGYLDAKPSFRIIEGIDYVKLNILNFNFEELGNVFLVSGRCTRNYFHWLIEYMPKLLWLKRSQLEDFSALDIAVDSLMPAQHYQALKFFLAKMGITNNVIRINPDKIIYQINRALICSNPTFIPDSIEEFSYLECSALNLETLSEFRNVFLDGLSNLHEKRIYIARSNNVNRKLVNESEVIGVFLRYKFQIIYPENLTFVEQMNTFNSAKFVVGPAGAAFTNLIFCQKNTIVINFLAEENKESSIFSNLCALSESEYFLATGKLLKTREFFTDKISWLYSDFEIDIPDLEKKLKSLLDSKSERPILF